MKKLILSTLAMFVSLLSFASCSEYNPATDPRQKKIESVGRGTFAKGADVSWFTQLESKGETFTNSKGIATDCIALLKDECGVNAIRLRVWVNPASCWNNTDDVLTKARRTAALGLRLMIDFHFSDTWADPGSQTPPAAWADYDLSEMKEAVKSHVTEMMDKLKQFDIEPEWVQIGNETRTGMLWPLGKIGNNANYAELTNAGYDAVKAIFPDCKVIVHIDCGDNLDLYTYVFNYMKAYGGKYDIIGMSFYPDADNWQSMTHACIANISSLFVTYGKPVVICEIGMNYQDAETCRDCIATLMEKGQATGHLEGIFYWEPEAPAGYNGGYDKGCFENGRPTVALDAFKEK